MLQVKKFGRGEEALLGCVAVGDMNEQLRRGSRSDGELAIVPAADHDAISCLIARFHLNRLSGFQIMALDEP